MPILLLITQVASTWFMVGLIWFVQIVHYPLFERVGQPFFMVYEGEHCSLTTIVVAPVMVVELLTALLMVVARPKAVALPEVLVGIVLLIMIWFSTLFIADQYHGQLAGGFDEKVLRALLAANWWRTFAWSLRGLVVSFMCFKAMQS